MNELLIALLIMALACPLLMWFMMRRRRDTNDRDHTP